MSRLKRNLGYQTVYQILAVGIPLITSPYLSRVLGAEGLGIYSYTYSIVYYFMLFAVLGLSKYGMRQIVQSKTREEVSRNFCGLFVCQLISAGLSLAAYVIYVTAFSAKYQLFFLIELLYLLSECVNINWLYFGLEEFKLTVTRSIFVKLLTTASLFVFVRRKEDLAVYVFILAFGQLLSNLLLWIRLKKYVDFVPVGAADILRHIKPNLMLFIPVIASSVYHMMDKTMLGYFSTETQSGYYYNADKLLNIPFTAVIGCCNVIMAQISVLVRDEKAEEYRALQGKSLKVGMLVSSALCFGIAAVSDLFCPMFFGGAFQPTVVLAKWFAIVILIKTVSTITCSACLIPLKKDGIYIFSVILGAAVNFIANYYMIKVLDMGALGATIGTLIAEAVVMVTQSCVFAFSARQNRYHIRQVFASQIFLLPGAMMFAAVQWVHRMLAFRAAVNLLIEIALGAVIYIGLTLLCLLAVKDQDILPMCRQAVRRLTGRRQ